MSIKKEDNKNGVKFPWFSCESNTPRLERKMLFLRKGGDIVFYNPEKRAKKIIDWKEYVKIRQLLMFMYVDDLITETEKCVIGESKFKEGDILFTRQKNGRECVFVLSDFASDNFIYSFVMLELGTKKLDIGFRSVLWKNLIEEIRQADDEEKHQFYDALATEGKCWNENTKMVETIKRVCVFRPFEKVVVFNSCDNTWQCDFFSHYSKFLEDGDSVNCVGGCYKKEDVLPFNGETAKLIGMVDNGKTC